MKFELFKQAHDDYIAAKDGTDPNPQTEETTAPPRPVDHGDTDGKIVIGDRVFPDFERYPEDGFPVWQDLPGGFPWADLDWDTWADDRPPPPKGYYVARWTWCGDWDDEDQEV